MRAAFRLTLAGSSVILVALFMGWAIDPFAGAITVIAALVGATVMAVIAYLATVSQDRPISTGKRPTPDRLALRARRHGEAARHSNSGRAGTPRASRTSARTYGEPPLPFR
jgi:hypothetical protein